MIEGFELRGFLPVSLNEWENRVSAVVFTPHCNWRCPYCHGWRLVTEPDTLQPFTVETVLEHLESKTGWIDGLVITGGEPTLQPGLIDFIRLIKEDYDLPVKLETNGTHPEVIEKLLSENLLACLCMDYKGPLDERLQNSTGVNVELTAVEKVKASYALAARSGIEREYHTTLCPAMINSNVIRDMAQALESGGTWFLQQFETEECLDREVVGTKRFNTEELNELEQIAKSAHEKVILKRGKVME